MKPKFIIIMEDGEVFKSDKITDVERNSCDAGILDVIDTENGKTYFEGEWHDLFVWGET